MEPEVTTSQSQFYGPLGEDSKPPAEAPGHQRMALYPEKPAQPGRADILSKPISYKEVFQWLLRLEIKPEVLRNLREEQVVDVSFCCLKKSRSMSDVPGLDQKLSAEKDLVMFLKITQFDFKVPTHHRMLRTIYCMLTESDVCPIEGGHWRALGFLSVDPCINLNSSGGLLAVLHMFFFFSHYPKIYEAMFRLAQDAGKSFALARESITVTAIIVECLLAGHLSKLCNSGEHGVFETTCMLFSAGLYNFALHWCKRSHKDLGAALGEVRQLMQRKPEQLLEGLDKSRAQDLRAKPDATTCISSSQAPAPVAPSHPRREGLLEYPDSSSDDGP